MQDEVYAGALLVAFEICVKVASYNGSYNGGKSHVCYPFRTSEL